MSWLSFTGDQWKLAALEFAPLLPLFYSLFSHGHFLFLKDMLVSRYDFCSNYIYTTSSTNKHKHPEQLMGRMVSTRWAHVQEKTKQIKGAGQAQWIESCQIKACVTYHWRPWQVDTWRDVIILFILLSMKPCIYPSIHIHPLLSLSQAGSSPLASARTGG